LSSSKHIVLFLAANQLGTAELALDEKARPIQQEPERSGHRTEFEFVTRPAVRPLDQLGELRSLKRTVVNCSGYSSR